MPNAEGGRRSGKAMVVLLLALSAALVALGVWGFWIAADVARFVPSDAKEAVRLRGVVFFLTWLVCFAPFLFFGCALLWSLFAPQDRSWLTPLRWFTWVVTLRAIAERRSLSQESQAKMLPPGQSRNALPGVIDVSQPTQKSDE